MRVTKEIAEIRYFEFNKTCYIGNVGKNMSEKEREKVTILEFPKVIKDDGKNWRVDTISFHNVKGVIKLGSYYFQEYYFPKLEKVKIPKGVQLFSEDGIEVERY